VGDNKEQTLMALSFRKGDQIITQNHRWDGCNTFKGVSELFTNHKSNFSELFTNHKPNLLREFKKVYIGFDHSELIANKFEWEMGMWNF